MIDEENTKKYITGNVHRSVI